jgi:hypothetical protein
MADTYLRDRKKLLKSLADHAHDKALESTEPHLMARWAVLSDMLLWCAAPEGDVDCLERLCRNPTTPTIPNAENGEI